MAAVVVLAGLASSASAQGFGVAGVGGNAFGGVGFGGLGYSGFNTGYTNFGVYGGGYNGYGYNGYYNGFNPYTGNYTARLYPQTQNNMFGLMNTIRTQTGKANSYRLYGYGNSFNGW